MKNASILFLADQSDALKMAHELEASCVTASKRNGDGADDDGGSAAAAKKNQKKRRVAVSASASAPVHQVAFVLKETVLLSVLDRIDACIERLPLTERAKFADYAKEARSRPSANGLYGSVKVYYELRGPAPYSRFYARGAASFQGQKRELRAALASDLYWQLDIENAHGIILLAAATANDWPAVALKEYCENRDGMLDSLASERTPREKVKLQLLIAMFGGKVAGECPPFVRTFQHTCKVLSEKIYAQGGELRRILESDAEFMRKSLYRRRFSLMSYLLQYREAQAITKVMEYLALRGWMTGAVLHDGVLLEKRADSLAPPDDGLLIALSQHIAIECNLPGISIRIKSFGESILDAEDAAAEQDGDRLWREAFENGADVADDDDDNDEGNVNHV